MRTTKENFKSYKQVKKFVTSNLNLFLKEKSQMSLGAGLQIEFSMGETVPYCSGLFTENGFIGMLEAADLDKVDKCRRSWALL